MPRAAQANLSPFNNRWSEPYNFTPNVGDVSFLPLGTPYTQLLPPLSSVTPELLTTEEEAAVARDCPVPPSVGLHAPTAAGLERAFLLVMPRRAEQAALWLRSLTAPASDGAPRCTLLRAREYTQVPPPFSRRLFERAPSGGKKLADAAAKGRLVGLELAGEGSLARLNSQALAWNMEAGEAVACAPSSRAESQHMADVFFENTDSGHAMG